MMSWAIEELRKLSEIQPEIIERTLKDVLERNPDIYKSVVIGAYVDKKISLSKAAELLGVTRVELQKGLKEKGVPIRIPSKEEAVAETEALKTWKS